MTGLAFVLVNYPFNQLWSFTIKNNLYSVDGAQGLTRSLFHCSGTCTVHSINVLC